VSSAEIVPLGNNALIIRLSNLLDAAANERARAIADAIDTARIHAVTDIVPANSSVGVYFTGDADSTAIRQRITSVIENEVALSHPQTRHHEVPVRYDGADLQEVARQTGLSVREITEIHSDREYQVFAIGFAPGFAYLGELDERIAVPRRSSPRTKVPAGSVAIANRQTAIYPFNTPGGWNLIGNTDVRVFDLNRDPASLFQVGDRVRFVAA
jgi:KipI family sensor histidine kinase inhibitor